MKRIGILIGWLVWTAGASAQSWSLDQLHEIRRGARYGGEAGRVVKPPAPAQAGITQHAVAGSCLPVTGGEQGQYTRGRNIDPETNTYRIM